MSDITDFENASTEITQDVMEAAGVAAVVTDEVPVGAIVVALTIIIEELLKGTDEIQDAVLAPLTATQRRRFVGLMSRLVESPRESHVGGAVGSDQQRM